MKKTDFDNTVSSLDSKIEGNKSLGAVLQRTLKGLESPDLGYFKGKNHFEDNGTQNFLVFQPSNKYLTSQNIFHHGNLRDYLTKLLNLLLHLIILLPPLIDYYNTNKIQVKFYGSILRQPKISYTHLNIVNIYMVYEFGASTSDNNDPTLKNCLFGAVTLTKNADIDNYKYSGYGIEFDRISSF